MTKLCYKNSKICKIKNAYSKLYAIKHIAPLSPNKILQHFRYAKLEHAFLQR